MANIPGLGLRAGNFGGFGGLSGTDAPGTGGFLSALPGLLTAAAPIVSSFFPRQQPAAAPMARPVTTQPTIAQAGMGGGLIGQLGSALGVGSAGTGVVPVDVGLLDFTGESASIFFRPTQAGFSARSLIPVEDPRGGITYFRHVGKPMLFRGDITNMRRTGRILAKAASKSRRRR